MRLIGFVLLLAASVLASGLPSLARLTGLDEDLNIAGFLLSDSFEMQSDTLESEKWMSLQSYYKALPQRNPFRQYSQVTEVLWVQKMDWLNYSASLAWTKSKVSYQDSLIDFIQNQNEISLMSSVDFNPLKNSEIRFDIELEKYFQKVKLDSRYTWKSQLLEVYLNPFMSYSQFNVMENIQFNKYMLDLQNMGALGILGSDFGIKMGSFNMDFGVEKEGGVRPESEVLSDLLSQNTWECRKANCIEFKTEKQKINSEIGFKLQRKYLLAWEYNTASTLLKVQNVDKAKPFIQNESNQIEQKLQLLSSSLSGGFLNEIGLKIHSLKLNQLPSRGEFSLESESFPVEGGEVLFSLFQKERWRSLSSIEYIEVGIPIRLSCLPSSLEAKGFSVNTELNPFLGLIQYKVFVENQKILSLLFISTEIQKSQNSSLWALYGFHPKVEFGYKSEYGMFSAYISQYIPVYIDVWKKQQDFLSTNLEFESEKEEPFEGSGGVQFGLRYTFGM
jgi:hypothetical protein